MRDADKMPKLRPLVEGLTPTVSRGCAQFADMVEVELWLVRWFITVAWSKSEVTVSDALCIMQDCFLVEWSRGSAVLSPGSYSGPP